MSEPSPSQIVGEVQDAAEQPEKGQRNQDRLHQAGDCRGRACPSPIMGTREGCPYRSPPEYQVDQAEGVDRGEERGQKPQEVEAAVESPPFLPDRGQDGILAEKTPG